MNDVSRPVVHIVDDDEAIRDAVSLLLETVGLEHRTYANGKEFLSAYQDEKLADSLGCILLDIRMPLMSGLECQQQLNEMHCTLPIIFLTGHADVPMAVEAMKKGAAEFIQKPFREQVLLDAIQKALETCEIHHQTSLAEADILAHFETLTPREKQVLQAMLDGKANKVIAYDLELSQRTVEIHRAKVMEKMQARNLASLLKMMLSVNIEKPVQ